LNNITETKKEKVNTEKIKFKDNSKLVQSSFIIGIIAITLTIIFFTIISVLQPKLWIVYTIYSLLVAIGIIGLIISSIAFRDGKNIYSILGFIFSFLTASIFIGGIIVLAASGF